MFKEISSPLEGMTEEELNSLIDSSNQRFEESHLRLIELCSSFDRVKLITSFYLSTLTRPLVREYQPDFQINYVHSEIVHACALTSNYGKSNPANESELVEELFEIMTEYFNIYEMMSKGKTKNLSPADESKALRSYMHKMITKYRRNWGFYDDVQEIVKDIIEKIDGKINQSCGLRLSVLKTILDIIFDRSGRIESFAHSALQDLKESENVNIDLFKYFYFSDQPEEYLSLFTITAQEVAKSAVVSVEEVEAVMSKLSYDASSTILLKGDVVLENPIWKKPFIKLGERDYIFSGVHVFPTNVFPIVDSILSDHKSAKEKWEKGFQDYIEDKAYDILSSRYPNSISLKNYYVGGKKGHSSEKDILFNSSDFIALFECKAVKYKDDASRGEWDRLGKHYKRSQIKAQSQVDEAYQQLFQDKKTKIVEADSKTISLVVEKINAVSKIVLIPYDFGVASGRPILGGGWNDTEGRDVLVMGLSDLMIITEVLDTEAEFADYLIRRSEVAKQVNFMSEETEFLAQYLKNRMRLDKSLYEVAQTSKQAVLLPPGRDEVIAIYKNEKYLGRKSKVPRVKVSEFWSRTLRKLQGAKQDHLHKVCSLLMDFSYENQLEVEGEVKEYCSRLSRFRIEEELYYFGYDCAFSDARVLFVVHYGEWKNSKQSRLEGVIMKLHSEAIKDTLIILVNAMNAHDAYEMLMLMNKKRSNEE